MTFFEANDEPQPFIQKHYTNEQIETLLENAIDEKDETTKGKLFEEFFRNVVERENEFVLVKPHARSDIGEFDFVYKTKCNGHPLWNECQYLFVECKNRKEVVSSKDMNHFVNMLSKKAVFKNARCGIYITTKSFSRQANTAAKNGIAEGLIIFKIAHKDIATLIEKGFKRFLEEEFDDLLSKI